MLTMKALEEGSRSFEAEATLVYHLLLSSVKTLSIFERQLTKLYIAIRMSRKLQKANKLACCVIVIE